MKSIADERLPGGPGARESASSIMVRHSSGGRKDSPTLSEIRRRLA
jgi:hypothetical protein